MRWPDSRRSTAPAPPLLSLRPRKQRTLRASRDWDIEAQGAFLAGASPEKLAGKIKAAAYAAGAFAAGQMVGFLLMPAPSLLGMLFVHPKWLRQGVARTLRESARTHIEAEFPAVKTVEPSSTPRALEFYRAVGFVPISAEFRRDGARDPNGLLASSAGSRRRDTARPSKIRTRMSPAWRNTV